MSNPMAMIIQKLAGNSSNGDSLATRRFEPRQTAPGFEFRV